MSEADLITISPNMINVFKECPQKFYYSYVEQISSPVLDKNFRTGKDIHALASYYLKGQDISKFESVLSEEELALWKKLKSSNYFRFDIIGVEQSMMAPLGDFWLSGRLDAIVKNNGDYYILDYKTGEVDGDMVYNPQTMVYLIMCDEWLKDYQSLSFVYLDLKKERDIKIPFSHELKEKYTEKLLGICNQIKNYNFNTTSIKKDCKCEYYNLCKFV